MDATTVIRGGLVVPVVPGGARAADIVIEGDMIAAIVAPGTGPRSADVVVDAGHGVVMPGLVQAHVHLCQTLFRGLADDMDVIEWLRRRIWPLEQAHDHASLRASAALGCAELLRGGTTAALTMESVHHTGAAFEAAELLGLRATTGSALMDKWEPGTEMIGLDTETAWAREVALVEQWHGAAGGRLRVGLSPRGPRNATVELWRRCVALAADADLRLHTHVDENRDQAELLGRSPEGRDVVALDAWGALGPRLVMAHGVWLDDAERRLMRERRPHVCHCPSSNLKLASGLAPIPDLLADGINVALGADGAPCNNRLDGFTEMRLAALLHKPAHGPRAMPARAVLEMATLGGARALGLDDLIGSLEVGKLADVIVVDRNGAHVAPVGGGDPVADLVYAHTADDVRTVLVGGDVVVRDHVLTTADEAAIVAEAEHQRAALLARVTLD